MASYLSWTAHAAGVHPRLWVSNTNGPVTGVPDVALMQSRATGTHASYYTQLKSFCDARIGSGYGISYFQGKESEYIGSFAMMYLISGNTDYSDKAIAIAIDYAGLSYDWGTGGRQKCLAMAMVYDWCYDQLNSSNKALLQNRIAGYVNSSTGWISRHSGSEYLWGHDHGDDIYALMAISTILNDGTTAQNTTWAGYVDTLMDYQDDNTSSGYLPVFRHFGDTDGGSHKGSGQNSYTERNEQFNARLFPTIHSALGEDWNTDEPWWHKWMDWQLWHWRCDRTFHMQGDCNQQASYSVHTQAHAMQVAERESGDFGLACQWLVNEIQDNSESGWAIWGPYYMYYMLWMDTTKGTTSTTPAAPTIAGYGGDAQQKVFANVGKICFRNGWGTTDTSVTLALPTYFTGGHQCRDAGHFDIASKGEIILGWHGHYDGNQTDVYQIPGYSTTNPADGDPTGHRYCYYKRIISKNCVRIMDSDEYSENYLDSCSVNTGAESGRFGIWNGSSVDYSEVGDQLWPKNTAQDDSGPDDLNDLVGGAADSKWVKTTTMAHNSKTDGTYAYAVGLLTPWYYSGKVTGFYRRHLLWVEAGKISGWNEPVLIVWDSLDTHADATYGKLTQVLQLQSFAAPTGTAASLSFAVNDARVHVKCLAPASVEKTDVVGFKDVAGDTYHATDIDANDDSGSSVTGTGAFRTELNQPSASGTVDFLTVYFPCEDPHSTLPAVALVSDATWYGVQFNGSSGLIAKMKKGTSYEASVAIDEAPEAPTGLQASPFSTTRIDLDWTDNTEGDLDKYNLYHSTWSGSAWGAWSSAVDCGSTSSYSHTGLTASTTYRYKVTAVDANSHESDASSIVSATTNASPPASGSGAGVAPWRSGRKFSKFYLDLS